MKNMLNIFSKKQAVSYQEKRDNDENWNFINKHLDKNSQNLLDVACDAGFYSFKAADAGIFTLGIDILDSSLKKANDLVAANRIEGVAFMKMALSPSNIQHLPRFDVIFCLSVFHHFYRLYGEDKAINMVLSLYQNCRKQLFFQIPSKIGKYGEGFSVDFKEEIELIDSYVKGIFSEVEGCDISLIGSKREKPPNENHRHLFLIEKRK